MKKYILLVLISTSSFSQEIVNQKDQDSLIKTFNLEEVTVNAIKAKYLKYRETTYSQISKIWLSKSLNMF